MNTVGYEAGSDHEPSQSIGIDPEESVRTTKLISDQLVLLIV